MNLAQLNLRRRSDERREQHAKPAIRLGLRCGVSRVLRIIHHTSDRRGCRAPLSRPGHRVNDARRRSRPAETAPCFRQQRRQYV